MPKNSLVIARVSIDSLRLPVLPMQWNPKTQIEKAIKFEARFGETSLIYAGADGEILSGEEFFLARKQSGASEVDVVFLQDKSPTELKAIRLALHRIPEDARWINHNVRVVLDEIETAGIDLDVTGFDPLQIDGLVNLDLPGANVDESGAEIPETENVAVSNLGMIWQMGDHRLGCGDATDLEFARQVFQGRCASMSFIDAPRKMPVRKSGSRQGRNRRRKFDQQTGELSDEHYFMLLRDALAVLQTLSSDVSLIYSCIDWRHVMEMMVAGRACGLPLSQIIAWIKSHGRVDGGYRDDYELICVFRAGHIIPLNNVELRQRGRARSNVWQHYGALSSFINGQGEPLTRHPTVKPVAMIADAIRDCTKRKDLVADTFTGSGSTMMAAEETGRVFCGIELDPLFVDVAIRRWQNLTGREAVLAKDGERFNSVRQRLLSAPTEPHHE